MFIFNSWPTSHRIGTVLPSQRSDSWSGALFEYYFSERGTWVQRWALRLPWFQCVGGEFQRVKASANLSSLQADLRSPFVSVIMNKFREEIVEDRSHRWNFTFLEKHYFHQGCNHHRYWVIIRNGQIVPFNTMCGCSAALRYAFLVVRMAKSFQS